MAERDRERWNEKYTQNPEALEREHPSPTLEKWWHLAGGPTAVDLACGGGRNALYLARQGLRVDAFDISDTAIERLQSRIGDLPLRAERVDLTAWRPPAGRYDLAVMANFLDRALLLRTARALRRGGLIVVETYMAHPENEKRGNPDYLLAPGELVGFFGPGFDRLHYEEFWCDNERFGMYKQAVVVRKRSRD